MPSRRMRLINAEAAKVLPLRAEDDPDQPRLLGRKLASARAAGIDVQFRRQVTCYFEAGVYRSRDRLGPHFHGVPQRIGNPPAGRKTPNNILYQASRSNLANLMEQQRASYRRPLPAQESNSNVAGVVQRSMLQRGMPAFEQGRFACAGKGRPGIAGANAERTSSCDPSFPSPPGSGLQLCRRRKAFRWVFHHGREQLQCDRLRCNRR